MKLAHRFAYYLGGFTIGLIFLFFFLSGKRTSCEYSPNARVLKNIRIKERHFAEAAEQQMISRQIDTAQISQILRTGDVLFSESNTKLDSCKLYVIQAELENKEIKVRIENCEEKATVMEFLN